MQSSINQRFTQTLTLKKMDQKKFSELANITEATISNIAKGKTKDPKADFFIAFAKVFPDINLRWLLLGELPVTMDGSINQVNEPESVYQRGYEKEVSKLLNVMEQQSSTFAKMTDIVREMPELRKEIEKLKKEIESLKKTGL
jgi:transcriptional regulator with XRE-family HTH domain